MMIFGRSGTNLLPMFEQGAAGINKLQKEAERLGLTMSDEDAKSAEDLTDAFDALWQVTKMGVVQIGAKLSPELIRLGNHLKESAANVVRFIRANGDLIARAAKVAVAIALAGAAITTFGATIFGVGAVLGGVSTIFSTFAAIVGALFTPLGLIAAVGATLMALFAKWLIGTNLLSDGFETLKKNTEGIRGSISDALVNDNLVGAVKVMWGKVVLVYLKSLHAIRSAIEETILKSKVAFAILSHPLDRKAGMRAADNVRADFSVDMDRMDRENEIADAETDLETAEQEVSASLQLAEAVTAAAKAAEGAAKGVSSETAKLNKAVEGMDTRTVDEIKGLMDARSVKDIMAVAAASPGENSRAQGGFNAAAMQSLQAVNNHDNQMLIAAKKTADNTSVLAEVPLLSFQ